jgi:pectin methylesterase-like acyl-CoA thioesterase
MPYVRLYARPSLRPSSAAKPDLAAARSQLDTFVATVKKAVSAARAPKSAAANSVVVDPGGKSFATIGAALDSITDASEKKQYVVSIGAGTYNEVVTCKSWVFLTGAGQDQTLITALSEANPFVAGTLKAASHSAVQNCTVRATTTGTFGDSVTAVNCQGAVDFDIENCELLAISATNQTNVTGILLDYWGDASGSQVNISYTTVTAKGGASPLALSTGWYSNVHGMESRFIAEGGQQPWGCAAIDESVILVENCYVQGAEYSLWQDSTGRITANQCQLIGPVGPGVVVNN